MIVITDAGLCVCVVCVVLVLCTVLIKPRTSCVMVKYCDTKLFVPFTSKLLRLGLNLFSSSGGFAIFLPQSPR